jgi:hypothetical protein
VVKIRLIVQRPLSNWACRFAVFADRTLQLSSWFPTLVFGG